MKEKRTSEHQCTGAPVHQNTSAPVVLINNWCSGALVRWCSSRRVLAFTLTELMIVVVIIGIIAAFAVPNYTRAVERAHLRDAIVQLTTVHAANQIYRAEKGRYWPSTTDSQDLAAINAALDLGIIANGMTYTCVGVLAGTSFTCTAVRDPPAAAFTVTVTQAPVSSSNPGCTAGACP